VNQSTVPSSLVNAESAWIIVKATLCVSVYEMRESRVIVAAEAEILMFLAIMHTIDCKSGSQGGKYRIPP
jgi:folate-dependent tRNA-U54 methylase TrmFO/GidA